MPAMQQQERSSTAPSAAASCALAPLAAWRSTAMAPAAFCLPLAWLLRHSSSEHCSFCALRLLAACSSVAGHGRQSASLRQAALAADCRPRQASQTATSSVAGADSATEVDRHFENHGFSAVHPRTRTGITSAACRRRARAAQRSRVLDGGSNGGRAAVRLGRCTSWRSTGAQRPEEHARSTLLPSARFACGAMPGWHAACENAAAS